MSPSCATPLGARVPYGALALDLDGTLLSENNRVEPETAALLSRFARAFPVCIVTGRMEAGALAPYRACGLSTPLVSYNGAKIAVPGQAPRYRAVLAADTVAGLYAVGRRHPEWQVNFYIGDELFSPADTPLAHWYTEHYGVAFRVADPAFLLAGAPYKMLFVVPAESHAAARAEIMAAVPAGAAHFTSSSRVFVEALPPGCDKGDGLARLAAFLGIPLDRWVAVGDAPNDNEMLARAGLGVAVENGHPDTVAAADRTVAPLWPSGLPALLAEAFDFR